MATFFFRAVAADGKVRTGSLAGENDKTVARELRKQGLTPVYVGVAPKKQLVELKLPSFGGGKRRDVLFFTQELSTLLNSGVPLDRALSITAELTERAAFRTIVLDVLRVLKGGKSLADSLATHPDYFSDLYINMVRAGEASGSLAIDLRAPVGIRALARRSAQLHHFVHDLSRRCWPGGPGLDPHPAEFRGAALRHHLRRHPHMKIPLPTLIMLEASHIVQTYWWWRRRRWSALVVAWRIYIAHRRRAALVGRSCA